MNGTSNGRLWLLVGAILALAVLVGGYFLGVAPALGQAKTASDQVIAVEAQNAAHANVLAQLREQAKSVDEFSDQLSQLREELPSEAGYADFMRRTAQVAALTGVAVTSVTANDAVLFVLSSGQSDSPPADGSTAADGSAAQSVNPPPDAGADPDGEGPLTPPAATPVGETGLIAIPLIVTVSGTDEAVFNFLDGMRMGSRIFLISDFGSIATTDPALFEGTLSGVLYVMPDTSSPSDADVAPG